MLLQQHWRQLSYITLFIIKLKIVTFWKKLEMTVSGDLLKRYYTNDFKMKIVCKLNLRIHLQEHLSVN